MGIPLVLGNIDCLGRCPCESPRKRRLLIVSALRYWSTDIIIQFGRSRDRDA
jgi:hypothetical protein